METVQTSSIKTQLYLRKEKLTHAIETSSGSSNLIDLLKQVDTALEKIDSDTYGICEICHDAVEEERLLIDPLISVCLGCLDEHQQRALENDLEFAAKIQRNLLPKNNLKVDGWEFSYQYNPAGPVSGDFVDLINLNDDSLLFVIGDVSGKGIAASLMMTHLNGLIHSLLSFGLPVNEIVEKANRLFCESTLFTNYATLIMGKASPDGNVEICVAGHNPPLISQGDKIRPVAATGIPVGLFHESEYTLEKFSLNKGDSIFLYTDGLTESMVNDIEYGSERIKAQLINANGNTPKDFVDSLMKDHKTWLGNSKPADDVTVLMIKRN